MLDLRLHDLVHQMFHLFLNVIRTSHSDAIYSNMENIMTLIIRNNVDCDESASELAMILLARLKKQNQNVSTVAFRLAENTFKNCSNDIKTYLLEAVRCLGIPVEDYAEVVVSLFHDATQREDMDYENVIDDASCHGEAGLPIDGGSFSLAEGHGTENLETHDNFHENQQTTSQCCHGPNNLGSPKQQQEMQPEDVPIRKKRSRKPNSLMKLEEGYDPLWMLGSYTSMRNPRCGNNKRKKIGHEPEDNLGSPKEQVQPEDVPIREKRCRKPNSLLKLEEGYDPLWMLGSCTTMRNSDCGNKKRKKIGHPQKYMISKESPLSCRPAGEPSSAPISQKANMITEHYIKRQGSLRKVLVEGKRKGKNNVSEDLKVDVIAKNHLEIRQGSSSKVASTKKSRGKAVISEDLKEDVLIKTLASKSKLKSSKGKALSGEVSNPLRETKSTTSKQEDSKVRDASKCFGDKLVGRRIKVWWPLDEMFYDGKITFFDHSNEKHKVTYDDGETEILDLAEECWQLIGGVVED